MLICLSKSNTYNNKNQPAKFSSGMAESAYPRTNI